MELLQALLAGQKAWLRDLWKGNRLRVLATVIPLVLLSFCAGQALGAEPTRLAGENTPFRLTTPTEVAYCSTPTHAACEWRLFQPGTYTASNQSWGNDPQPGVQKAAWGRAPEAQPPVSTAEPFKVCAIDWSLDILLRVKLHQSIPPEVGSSKTYYAVWPCKDKTAQVQIYTMAEFLGLASSGAKDEASATAYAATQPVTAYTERERTFIHAVRAEHEARLWPAQTAQTYKVAPLNGSADRPVVKLNAGGTTSTVSGVRVAFNTPCNPDKRAGNYMSVEGQLDTQGRVLGDVYAICQEAK